VKFNPATRSQSETNRKIDWLANIFWGVAVLMVALMVFVVIQRLVLPPAAPPAPPAPTPVQTIPESSGAASMPAYEPSSGGVSGLVRVSKVDTDLPEKSRMEGTSYTVQKGDSVFGIAKEFSLQPESVLWANYETLQDDPQMVEVGLPLNIPPTDGVYYKWKEGDKVEKVAERYHADVLKILAWPGNNLDITNPVFEPGKFYMIPEGTSEFRVWVIPDFAKGKSGTTASISGPGACDTGDGGAVGYGSFIWPTSSAHGISGNDYWGGHLGIDIASLTGNMILAADSGVVTYSGPIGGGYGIMVMIDHGNGYRTVYAHLDQTKVSCGQSVSQGHVIALSGNTGNSTGPHLHFEVRYYGGFVNPWSILN
jgi:LysM repeat protein